jgi:hypothetical protein
LAVSVEFHAAGQGPERDTLKLCAITVCMPHKMGAPLIARIFTWINFDNSRLPVLFSLAPPHKLCVNTGLPSLGNLQAVSLAPPIGGAFFCGGVVPPGGRIDLLPRRPDA